MPGTRLQRLIAQKPEKPATVPPSPPWSGAVTTANQIGPCDFDGAILPPAGSRRRRCWGRSGHV